MSYSGKFKDKDNNLHPVTSVLYGTCDTAAATAAKVVTCSDFDRLMTGVTIRVKFTYGNTAASPTVNINNTGATAVYCYGSTAPVGGTSWQAGAVVELVYDGTSFFIVGSATSGSDDIVAAEFSTATTYAAGDYCIYDGCLYKFKTSHTGAWAAADVDSITVTGELKGKQDIFERISYADWQLLSPQQQAAKPYYIYDYPSTAITAANVSYDHTQSGLSATTAQGGIDELASEKQDATDNNLTTTNKTIVGGINEIKSGLTNIAKGYYTSYNDHTKWYHIGNITIPEIKWVRHMSIISVNGSVIRNLMFRSVLTDDVGFDNNETKIIEVYSSTTSTAIVGLIISNDKKSVDVYIKGGNFGNRTYSVLSDGGEGTINYFNPVETDLTDADMAVTG